jgi:hypothetical protein
MAKSRVTGAIYSRDMALQADGPMLGNGQQATARYRDYTMIEVSKRS